MQAGSDHRMNLEPDPDPADLEAEGIPAIEDQPMGTDDPVEGMMPPRDHALAVDDLVTAADQLRGDTLAERVQREEPDRLPSYDEPVGRLVQPDQGVADLDYEAEETADAVASDAGGLSAEEAAVHLTDTP